MNIDLVVVGKTTDSHIREGIDLYAGRIRKYLPFKVVVIPEHKNSKNNLPALKKEKEGEALCKLLSGYDYIVLLDEKGREFTSVDFAEWLRQKTITRTKRMAFVIGGAYGFSDNVYALASEKLSLSKMTFSHQIIRMIFAEQLYRGFTLLNNEPYHHP